jgi:cyclopropane fatty-acyl-phospholipid synthase-like methyltransferase
MNDIIEHFNNQEIVEILKLVNKNLVENGKLVIKVVNASNPILGNSSQYNDFTHEIGFTEESLSQVLRMCGFNTVLIYPQDIYVFYHNPLNYVANFFSKLLNFIFRLAFVLYSRKTTKIFTRDMIAVAVKK